MRGLLPVIFLSVGCACLYGQTLGEIAGEIKDASGASVPGAAVTVTNAGTNAARTAATNDSGIYNFPALPPGMYSVRVEHAGFRPSARNDIELQVQQTARVDFTMTVGDVGQSIEVTAAAPQLNTEDATVGTVIENKRIVDLPLNGRDFLQLVGLSPNVTTGFAAPGQAALRAGGSRASENISVMGERGTANYYTLDGVNDTDVNFNLYIFLPSIDALEEFKVQTGVYPAEFGREASQINVSTKSGTNQFHGALFEFLRNDVLDAKQYDFIGTSPAKNPFKWNQYGFTLGGPVWIPKVFNGHDKLFFMSNYEGFRLRQSNNALYTVPTETLRGGDFSSLLPGNVLYDPNTKTGPGTGTPYPGNIIPKNEISATSVKLLQYLPPPNLVTPTLNKNYEIVQASPTNKDQFTQRIDWVESEKSTWFGRYSWTDENSLAQGIYLNGSTVVSNAKQAMISNTRIFSATKVNEARFGVNDFHNVLGTELAGKTDVVDQLGIPGLTGVNSLSWGIPQVGGFTDGISTFGNNTSAPFVVADTTFQFVDNFSWTFGKHAVRFGGEVRRDRYNQYGNEFSRGQFLFNGSMTRNPKTNSGGDSLADMLTGFCSTCADATSLAFTQFRATSQAYYIDDTWRVAPKLTVSLGLRYEYTQPWNDKSQNILSTQVPFLLNTTNATDPGVQPTIVRPGSGDFYTGHENIRFAAPIQVARENLYGSGALVKPDYRDFAPRVGVAYSPASNWTIRTGFGIFYSQDSGNSRFDMARGWGRINQQSNPNAPNVSYQNFIGFNGSFITLSVPNVYELKPDLKSPYTIQYLLNIQHQWGSKTVVEVGYDGSEGHRLEGLQNMNPAIPGTVGNASSRAPFPYLGIIQAVQGEVNSNYQALSVKVTRRLAAGLTYLSAYTWSKSLDDGSALRGTASDILPQDSRCLACDYGYSAFNIPNRFVTSVLYEVPFGKGKRFANTGGLMNEILGGWQVGSIVTWESGLPLNTQAGVDEPGTGGYGEIRLNSTGISPNLAGGQATTGRWFNPAAFALPAPGTFGNFMRNELEGPSLFNWDSSAIKNFRIREGQNLQFRWEMFNAGNHANWAEPNPNWSSTNPAKPGAAFLTISGTQTAMREMQFALKYTF
ncbi:MAG: carboxypeptidase-like regulatory domain-containing protein [Bryobacteraceae bacterium]